VELKIRVDKLDFGKSIVGFEHLKYFRLDKIEGDNPFFLLRDDDGHVEFVVISPFIVNQDYEIQLSDELKDELRMESPEDVLVLCIITVNEPFNESTINLVAPLVININNGMSRQIILAGKSYQAKSRLFPAQGKGE